MPGGKTIDFYKRNWPHMVFVCVVCEKEFVPKLEGRRGKATITCSMECSKKYCRMSKKEKDRRKMKWGRS